MIEGKKVREKEERGERGKGKKPVRRAYDASVISQKSACSEYYEPWPKKEARNKFVHEGRVWL